MSDCPRAGKLIGACNFEPRYDEEPVELVSDVVGIRNKW